MSISKNISIYKNCYIIQINKSGISNYLDTIKKIIQKNYIKCKEKLDIGFYKYYLTIITLGIEGVYIGSCDTKTNKLKLREKIVKADFISGDEYWTKKTNTQYCIII